LIALLLGAICVISIQLINIAAIRYPGGVIKKELEKYPYIASADQAARIRNGYKKITMGMSPAEVTAILGQPDEVRGLYEPKYFNAKIIGSTYWYVLCRLSKNGGIHEGNWSFVRVIFDLHNLVVEVDPEDQGDVYPRMTSDEQAARIESGYQKITKGMSPAEVAAILGQPDDVRPWYEGKRIFPDLASPDRKMMGSTYLYELRRFVKYGDYNEVDKSFVRISFDLNDRVVYSDQKDMEQTYLDSSDHDQIASKIMSNYKKIIHGMSVAEVSEILPPPGKVKLLYEYGTKDQKIIGSVYWYVIRNRVKFGGDDEKTNGVFVRVSFDLQNRVMEVNHEGLEKPLTDMKKPECAC